MPQNLENGEKILRNDKSDEGKLDYAIFLFVFHKGKHEEIARLLKPLVEKVEKKDQFDYGNFKGGDLKYDGSIKSIINSIIIAGLCIEPYYVITSPFIRKEPSLIRATEPYFGSNRDNFLPHCGGKKWDKGFVKNFPYSEVEAFLKPYKILCQKDKGTTRHTVMAMQELNYSYMIYNPNHFLKKTYPKMKNSSPYNRKEYKIAIESLIRYYRSEFKLNAKDSTKAARNAFNEWLNLYNSSDIET